MSSQRHILQRYEPGRSQDFDEQFWPVAMAVCILAAFSVGSILTILNGPWMWGSLLAIPLLVGLGLLVLSHIEHRFWRRSIQFSLLLSLAFHLLVLIIAYRAAIFSGKNPLQVSVQRHITPIPQLEISVRQTEEIWNQPNEIETPETQVTTERQTITQPNESQPTPNVASEVSPAQPNPNLERSEPQSNVSPQSGDALSQRSRSLEGVARQVRELSMESPSAPAAASRAQPAPSREVEPTAAARRESRENEATNLARRQVEPETRELARNRNAQRREEQMAASAMAAARQPRRSAEVVPEPTSAPNIPPRPNHTEAEITNAQHDLPAADLAAARRETSRSLTRETVEAATASTPTERMPERSETPQVADAMAETQAANRAQRQRQAQAPLESKLPETESPRAQVAESSIQPSPDAAEISRQAIPDSEWSANSRVAELAANTPTDQMAREIQRRAVPVERPSDVPSDSTEPRLARDIAAQPTTTVSVEAPGVVAAAGEPTPATMEARPLALSRSTQGVTGAGATPNFGRAADSMATPALVASDSARREQAESTVSEAEALAPSESAVANRSTTGLQTPRASVPNATSDSSERMSGAQPQPLSASSAASLNSARASGQRSELSADAGSSDIDIASTKIVSGAARSESAGGGQPEISDAQPATSQSAARNGNSQASIVADTTAPTVAAPLSTSSGQPANPRSDPAASAAVIQRRGGSNAVARGPSRGDTAGDPAEFSSAPETDRALSSRQSRRSNRGTEGEESLEDDQPRDLRQATARRQSAVDGPEASGQPRGLAQQSAAAEESPSLEASRSEISRSDRSDSIAATSPSQSSSDDGQSGTNRVTSNSMQRRGEDAPQTASQPEAMASAPQRESRSLEFEMGSGNDGTEFSAGVAQTHSDESNPQAFESGRAEGRGQESIGPATRRDLVSATSSSSLSEGLGRAEGTDEDVADASPSGSRASRTGAATLDVEDSSATASLSGTGRGSAADDSNQNDRVSSSRRSDAAQAKVEIDWDDGAGGLGSERASNLGVPSRRSSSSDVIAAEPTSRFRRREPSGGLSANSQATIAKAPFSGRNPGNLGRSGPQTERAIELGLAFLIRNQKADGHWSLLGFDDGHPSKQMQLDSDTAATGLALLAFQGAGYTHREFKYADRLQRAVAWLVAHQSADGNLYVESDKVSNASCQLYSHAIAALALAEAYGMTQDPALREPAQRAIDFIVETQDPKAGGWRYQTTPALRETDTSVTGWMVMALHSARLAGLEVEAKVWDGVSDWLETARAPEGQNQFVYSPHLQDDPNRRIIRSHMRRASNCMTAVGLLMQIYLQSEHSNPNIAEGAATLLKQLPSEYSMEVRDTYYWYYATQVLRHVDGPGWQAWYNALHPLLVGSQVPEGELAGSWSPYTPVEDKFGRFGGRLYVTTLNLLSLEVDYRLLPLYEDTTSERD